MLNAGNQPTAQSITRWVLIAFVAVLILVAIWLIRDIVMLTLTAIILAILLTTPVRFFVRRGIRRPFAVLLTIVLIVAAIVIVALLLFPALFSQLATLITVTLPSAAEQIRSDMTPAKLTARYPFLQGVALAPLLDQITQSIPDSLAHLPSQVFPFVGSVASTLVSILIVLFLSLYFVADPNTHTQGLIKLIPIQHRPRAYQILVALDETLRRYLHAQVILMAMIGFGTGIALALMGVPLAGAIGTLTGIFSFVPNFGPLVSLVPLVAVAIINTPDKLLLIIVVYYVLQTIQSQLVTPLLLGQGINMPPAMILLSQIIAGIFFGFLGLLLAVPLAAIATVLVREIYIKDILGDTERGKPHIDPELAELVADGI